MFVKTENWLAGKGKFYCMQIKCSILKEGRRQQRKEVYFLPQPCLGQELLQREELLGTDTWSLKAACHWGLTLQQTAWARQKPSGPLLSPTGFLLQLMLTLTSVSLPITTVVVLGFLLSPSLSLQRASSLSDKGLSLLPCLKLFHPLIHPSWIFFLIRVNHSDARFFELLQC